MTNRLRALTYIPLTIDFWKGTEIPPYVRLNLEKLCTTHIESLVCDLPISKSAGILDILLEVENYVLNHKVITSPSFKSMLNDTKRKSKKQ